MLLISSAFRPVEVAMLLFRDHRHVAMISINSIIAIAARRTIPHTTPEARDPRSSLRTFLDDVSDPAEPPT